MELDDQKADLLRGHHETPEEDAGRLRSAGLRAPTPEPDPSAILRRAGEVQAQREAAENDLRARQEWVERALLAWQPLRYFAPAKATPKGRALVRCNSRTYCLGLAARVLAFVAELPGLGRADRLASVSPGDDRKQYAVAVFRKAADGDKRAVVKLLVDATKHRDFWPPVWHWISHGIPEEILGDGCPNCGGLRKLEDWQRWCEKCRGLGELARAGGLAHPAHCTAGDKGDRSI